MEGENQRAAEAQGRSESGWLARLGLARPEARAWALYDWANSAVLTTIVAAVFPVYFAEVLAADLDKDTAQKYYSRATVIALSAIAVLAPFLGALADVRAAKKRLLALFAAIGIASTAALFFAGHGEWNQALVLFGLTNVGVAGSIIFYDALLPHVAEKGKLDQLSTSGFALGYIGGGLLLALNLAWILRPAWFGLPAGEGLTSAQATLPTRLAFVSVAVWWALFSIPLFRRIPEPPLVREQDEAPGDSPLRTALQRLKETFSELRGYRQAFLMLVAFLIYNDGIATVIRMASIYAKGQELDSTVIIGTLLLVQFVGVPFSLVFGRFARRFGAKPMVLLGLLVYVGVCVFAYFMTTNVHFVILGFVVGMVQGGTQGLSRSLFASMIPRHKSGEFFAFFAVGEKFAGILGPLLFTLVIEYTGTAQNAIISVAVFFVIGGLLMTRVDVEKGRRVARAVDATVESRE